MKLGFDVDGIVANMPKVMVEHINDKFGLDYTENVFVCHNIFDNTYVEDQEENEKIAMSMLDEVIADKDTLLSVPVYEDAVEALRKLSKSGHSLHYITSRPKEQIKVTVDWFRLNQVPFDSIDAVGKNGKKGNLVGKGQTARTLNLDFYIDDCTDHLDDMYRYKNRWRKGVALYTRPWNVNDLLDPSRFIRFHNWKEIIRHIGIHKR